MSWDHNKFILKIKSKQKKIFEFKNGLKLKILIAIK